MSQFELSPAQRRMLDVGLAQQKVLGRAVVLRELADSSGRAISTTHRRVWALVAAGVAKRSERGPGFIFRPPHAEISASIWAICKRHALPDHVVGEFLRAAEKW